MKHQLDPDEVFLDASNLPRFNLQQFEGWMERPLRRFTFQLLAGGALLVALVFLGRLADLQLRRGQTFALQAENNTLRHSPIFPDRGTLTDRLGEALAWDEPVTAEAASSTASVKLTKRQYIKAPGFGHLLGYVAYPTAEELETGDYSPEELVGRDGAELAFETALHGQTGLKVEEVNVHGQINSDHVLEAAVPGEKIALTIDARLQGALFAVINKRVENGVFKAGAGVLMDIASGELLALTGAPEFDPNVLVNRSDTAKIKSYFNDPRLLFLDRAIAGQYTPGSIVKPIMALAALNEGVITPEKKILSTGSISLPNPYNPDAPSVFKDWKAHGWVDVRRALAVSSDVYFYEVGGGYGEIKGLGIARINDYARRFGLGEPTGINLGGESSGVIPNEAWKAKYFPDDPWRIGDTYHTVIGQYGFQVTPIQMARAVAGIASSGYLPTPTILPRMTGETAPLTVVPGIKPEYYQIVREGMRQAVESETAVALNTHAVAVAGKTGTAQVGAGNSEVNSWVIGFFPYDKPRYAFAVVMERAKAGNLIGAPAVMREFLDWMALYTPDYLV
jgi:penicillin-binding protein 2